MKLAFASLLLGALASTQAEELRGSPALRNLELEPDLDYVWLVSNIKEEPWCLVVKGTDNFDKLGFEPCDLDGPLNQLWHIDDDGKLHAGVAFSQCMMTGYGSNTSPPITMRHAACNTNTDLNVFDYDLLDKTLSPAELPGLCVANRGVNANPGDTILALECADEGRFQWDLLPFDPDIIDPPEIFVNASPLNYPGCIGAEDGTANDDSKLILQTCDLDAPYQNWRVDEDNLFRLRMGGGDKCLQASRGPPPRDGEKLRIFECDPSNDLQKFRWDIEENGSIKPQGYRDLCVVFRGDNANLDVDPIILKTCDNIDRSRIRWQAI